MLIAGTYSPIYNVNVIKGYTASIIYPKLQYTSNDGAVSVAVTNLPDFATSSYINGGDLLVSFGTGSSIYPLLTSFNTNINYSDGSDDISYTSQIKIVNNTVSSVPIGTVSLTVPYGYTNIIPLSNYHSVLKGTVSYNFLWTYSNIGAAGLNTPPIYINNLSSEYFTYKNEQYITQSILYTTNNEYRTNLATHSILIEYINPYAIVATNSSPISNYGGYIFSYDILQDYIGLNKSIIPDIIPSFATISNGVLTGFGNTSNVGSYTMSYYVVTEYDFNYYSRVLTILDNTLFETLPLTTKYTIGGQYLTHSLYNNYTTSTGSITLNIVSIPSWLTYSNGILNGTSSTSNVGANSVSYTVTNGFRTFTRNLPIVVIDNTVSKISTVPNQITYASTTYSINLKNYYASYTGSLSIIYSPLPSWLTASGFTVSGVPTTFNVGTYTVGYTVSNTFRSLYDSYNVNVKLSNIVKTATQSITHSITGVFYSGTISLNKYTTEYGSVSIATYSFPNWLSFNPSTKIYSGTPSATVSSIGYLTLTNGLSSYLDTLTFITDNVTLDKIKYHDRQDISIGQFFEFVLKKDEYSSNITPLVISTVSKPNWLTYYSSNNTIAGIAPLSAVGVNIVTYSITNNIRSAVDYVYVDVSNALNVSLLPQPYDISIKHIRSTSFNLNWKKPSYFTSDINSIVVITDSPTASLSYPTHRNYVGNLNYNLAPYLGLNTNCVSSSYSTSSNWKVVYNGSSTSVSVLGLSSATNYRIAIFNYTSNDISTCGTMIYSTETSKIVETSAIVFNIKSANGNIIKDAVVTIYDIYNNVVDIANVNENGYYYSNELETEVSYSFTVEKVGYYKYERSGFYNRKDMLGYTNDLDSIMKWNTRGRTPMEQKGKNYINPTNTINITLTKI